MMSRSEIKRPVRVRGELTSIENVEDGSVIITRSLSHGSGMEFGRLHPTHSGGDPRPKRGRYLPSSRSRAAGAAPPTPRLGGFSASGSTPDARCHEGPRLHAQAAEAGGWGYPEQPQRRTHMIRARCVEARNATKARLGRR
jgi:hypothetical protein